MKKTVYTLGNSVALNASELGTLTAKLRNMAAQAIQNGLSVNIGGLNVKLADPKSLSDSLFDELYNSYKDAWLKKFADMTPEERKSTIAELGIEDEYIEEEVDLPEGGYTILCREDCYCGPRTRPLQFVSACSDATVAARVIYNSNPYDATTAYKNEFDESLNSSSGNVTIGEMTYSAAEMLLAIRRSEYFRRKHAFTVRRLFEELKNMKDGDEIKLSNYVVRFAAKKDQ